MSSKSPTPNLLISADTLISMSDEEDTQVIETGAKVAPTAEAAGKSLFQDLVIGCDLQVWPLSFADCDDFVIVSDAFDDRSQDSFKNDDSVVIVRGGYRGGGDAMSDSGGSLLAGQPDSAEHQRGRGERGGGGGGELEEGLGRPGGLWGRVGPGEGAEEGERGAEGEGGASGGGTNCLTCKTGFGGKLLFGGVMIWEFYSQANVASNKCTVEPDETLGDDFCREVVEPGDEILQKVDDDGIHSDTSVEHKMREFENLCREIEQKVSDLHNVSWKLNFWGLLWCLKLCRRKFLVLIQFLSLLWIEFLGNSFIFI